MAKMRAIDAAVRLDHGRDHAFDLVRFGYIRLDEGGIASRSLDPGDGVLQSRHIQVGYHHHLGPFALKRQGGSLSDAGTAACDQYNLILQRLCHKEEREILVFIAVPICESGGRANPLGVSQNQSASLE